MKRETRMGPSASRTRVAMIPSSFDLAALGNIAGALTRSSSAGLPAVARHPGIGDGLRNGWIRPTPPPAIS